MRASNGETNGSVRLSDADREAIRATLGRDTAASVAARYGVSKSCVDAIRRQRRE